MVLNVSVWEKVDEKTLEMLKAQKAFEDETVKRLTPLYESIKNPLAKSFINRIILDTMKHSHIYQTLIDLDRRALVGEINREKMIKELTDHIKEESKMVEKAVEISNSVKDKNFKKILDHVVEDERQHHKILQELYEIIKKEAKDWNRYLYEISSEF